MTVRYDAATGPSKGPAPGALAIRNHWRKVTGLGDLGIYNPRKIRGGQGWSLHAEGRAADLAANISNPAEKYHADRYCQFLIDNAEALQVQYLIWGKRSWKSGRGWRPYSGSFHGDHIHAELNRDGARDVTATQLDALWSAWTDDHTPTEDEVTEADIARISEIVATHNAKLYAEIDELLAKRGLVLDGEGGAIGEIRRNLRTVAKTVGVDAKDIED